MTNFATIEKTVNDIIRVLVEGSNIEFDRNSHLDDDLGIDSTELTFVLLEVEKAIESPLKNIDYSALKTVGDLVGFVHGVVMKRESEPTAA